MQAQNSRMSSKTDAIVYMPGSTGLIVLGEGTPRQATWAGRADEGKCRESEPWAWPPKSPGLLDYQTAQFPEGYVEPLANTVRDDAQEKKKGRGGEKG